MASASTVAAAAMAASAITMNCGSVALTTMEGSIARPQMSKLIILRITSTPRSIMNAPIPIQIRPWMVVHSRLM